MTTIRCCVRKLNPNSSASPASASACVRRRFAISHQAANTSGFASHAKMPKKRPIQPVSSTCQPSAHGCGSGAPVRNGAVNMATR
ncbi:hypothetical protein WM26_09230 [Burkholderia cepacia]|nr:hypothetical protein WM26_09230 [Burkholderia cepacia]